jgi:EAL domain-containing protein (putative c-di-GMP-specific phosphodiesterase class I)
MDHAAATSATLHALRQLGVKLAIDDFGTGYSSLSYLHRFAVDTLKIDRSFVHTMGADAERAAIVRAIVNLAHTLGLSVTAEGVETEAEAARLQALGGEQAQGYFFAQPGPWAFSEQLLAAGVFGPAPAVISVGALPLPAPERLAPTA